MNSATSTLILGQPGTGKSYYVKSVSSASSLQTFVVNGQEKDFNPDEGDNHISFEDLFEDEEDIRNCILIFEDIVRPDDKVAKSINKQLVHRKRHDNITTFVLSHGIEKNNLHSLIKHFDYVMFTNSNNNNAIFKSFAKKYCPKTVDECLIQWKDFVNKQPKTSYLRFNNIISQFEILDVKGNLLTNVDSKLRKKVFSFLNAVGETKQSMALYDYLVDVLPPGVISEDLQINFKSTDTKKTIKINIIDLLHYVTAKKENIIFPPRQEIIQVFKSMRELYNIPYVFIGNHYF